MKVNINAKFEQVEAQQLLDSICCNLHCTIVLMNNLTSNLMLNSCTNCLYMIELIRMKK